MRNDLLNRLGRGATIEPGHLPQLAGIAAALDALARSETERSVDAEVDDSGKEIRRIMHCDCGVAVAAELASTVAIELAGQLLSAAGNRLSDELVELRKVNPWLPSTPPRDDRDDADAADLLDAVLAAFFESGVWPDVIIQFERKRPDLFARLSDWVADRLLWPARPTRH
jgi:hypothetical protein